MFCFEIGVSDLRKMQRSMGSLSGQQACYFIFILLSFAANYKNDIRYPFLSNALHRCIELCQKSAHFSEECGTHHAKADKRCTPEVRHLQKHQVQTSRQVPIFAVGFVSAPYLV